MFFTTVITYRNGNDERASRALDILQAAFRCCGSDGRLSYQNNVPSSCSIYSAGCLTRTMFFLDSCMDGLAYVVLFFSLIKLFIVIYFYSFLCTYQRYRQKNSENSRHLINNSPQWGHSSSLDSSSTDNIPKKILLPSQTLKSNEINNRDNEYVEKRRVVLNEYDSESSNNRVQNPAMILPSSFNNNLPKSFDEQQQSLNLPSISEKTEKIEINDSESDLLHINQVNLKRKAIITAVNRKVKQPPPLPKKLPIVKNRRKIRRDDEYDNDSGIFDIH